MSLTEILNSLVPHKQMQFAPIEEDDDEISQAINDDPIVHDDQWRLTEDLDGQQLGAFWDTALSELGPELSEDEGENNIANGREADQ